MATESDLRDLLQHPASGDGGIDVDAVLRRARRRRRPRVLLSAAGGALALAAVVAPAIAITTLTSSPTTVVASQPEAADGAGADEATAPFADSSLRDACGSLVPTAAPTTGPLALDVTASGSVELTVGLVVRNTGAAAVAGETGQLRLAVIDASGALVASELASLPQAELAIPAGGAATSTLSVPLSDCATGGALPPGDYVVTVTTAIGGIDVSGAGTLTIS